MANNEAGRTRVDDAQASKLSVSTRMKYEYILLILSHLYIKSYVLNLPLRIYDVPSNYKVQ
jgi:hypothetical protein